MEIFDSVLVALLLFLLGGAATTEEVTQVTMPKRPCPLPDDILPCVCVLDEALYQMDLDCSAVLDEEELSIVFQATFPFKHFRKFTIYKNHNLKVLPTGVFGEVQFEEISITWGVLQSVENGAFASSYSTALTLDLSSNQLNVFPFHNVDNFTLLETLLINDNNLTSLSPMVSLTLRVLNLSHNTIHLIAANTFVGVPSLVEVHLASLELLQIYPGLPGGSTIIMFHNEVTLFEEEVWRPTLEDNVTVVLADNPLECGCDLEWVVLNPSAWLPHLHEPTCYDGVRVEDLDPNFYINYC